MPASFDDAVEMLKALAEPTRFRLVLLVSEQDLTVSDLTAILGQSQPRISRHLKLLVEAGMVERHQEGSWAYFRLSDRPLAARLVQSLKASVGDDDGALSRDAERLTEVRRERAERAASYFARNAEHWDRIRSLHVPDVDVERALMGALATAGRFEAHLDVGTGTAACWNSSRRSASVRSASTPRARCWRSPARNSTRRASRRRRCGRGTSIACPVRVAASIS